MRRILTFILLLSFYTTSPGQFRNSSWNMSVEQVKATEHISFDDVTFGALSKNVSHMGFKGSYRIGEESESVFNNFVFVNNQLKSGRFVFYRLEEQLIEQVILQLSELYGQYQYSYGNAKLVRLNKPVKNIDGGYMHYFLRGHSLQFTWRGENTTVTFRVVNTNSSLFGTWGWLTYYQNSYYENSVEPTLRRTTTALASAGGD